MKYLYSILFLSFLLTSCDETTINGGASTTSPSQPEQDRELHPKPIATPVQNTSAENKLIDVLKSCGNEFQREKRNRPDDYLYLGLVTQICMKHNMLNLKEASEILDVFNKENPSEKDYEDLARKILKGRKR